MLIKLSNGLEFRTQKAAIEHFRAMLNRYRDGEFISDNDSADLRTVLERHPEAQTKVGCGIASFFRNNAPPHDTSCFWVIRIDGTRTEFSYLSAVRGRGQIPGGYGELAAACREAVSADVIDFRDNYFRGHATPNGLAPCEATGALIAINESHVDHEYPQFSVLVLAFRYLQDWASIVPVGVLSVPADSQCGTTFIDSKIANAFRNFHLRCAKLRVVSTEFNLKRGRT